MSQLEQFFNCPHCGQNISMLFDLSVQEQRYIEDCEVCCAPIEIGYSAFDGELINFTIDN